MIGGAHHNMNLCVSSYLASHQLGSQISCGYRFFTNLFYQHLFRTKIIIVLKSFWPFLLGQTDFWTIIFLWQNIFGPKFSCLFFWIRLFLGDIFGLLWLFLDQFTFNQSYLLIIFCWPNTWSKFLFWPNFWFNFYLAKIVL